MDKYLERIKLIESQIAELDLTINKAESELDKTQNEKKKKEEDVINLSLEHSKKKNLKYRLINFPKFKNNLKLMALLVGLILIVPITVFIGLFSIISSTGMLNLFGLAYTLIISTKIIKDYKEHITSEVNQLSNLSIEELDNDIINIEKELKTVQGSINILNKSIHSIEHAIKGKAYKKNLLQEEINDIQRKREVAIASLCEDLLNNQYDNDHQDTPSFQKKLLSPYK